MGGLGCPCLMALHTAQCLNLALTAWEGLTQWPGPGPPVRSHSICAPKRGRPPKPWRLRKGSWGQPTAPLQGDENWGFRITSSSCVPSASTDDCRGHFTLFTGKARAHECLREGAAISRCCHHKMLASLHVLSFIQPKPLSFHCEGNA